METTGTVGYAAMFEQYHPTDLLKWCKLAEESGFSSVAALDRSRLWRPEQGQSAFVWSWMGALGAETSLRFGIGVPLQGYRYYPAIIAQAAATLEVMYPGRFWLGLDAGETLNEHMVGEYQPEAPTRLRILTEAIEVIRKLLIGEVVKYTGEYITLETTKLSTVPEVSPLIYAAIADPMMGKQTGRLCDGIITVGAVDEKIRTLMEKFEEGAHQENKDSQAMPHIIQLCVSWADSQQEAEEQAIREWANSSSPFPKVDLRNPEVKNRMLISADLEEHLEHIQHYVDLGFDEIYVHSVGFNQEGFIRAYGKRVVPNLRCLTKDEE